MLRMSFAINVLSIMFNDIYEYFKLIITFKCIHFVYFYLGTYKTNYIPKRASLDWCVILHIYTYITARVINYCILYQVSKVQQQQAIVKRDSVFSLSMLLKLLLPWIFATIIVAFMVHCIQKILIRLYLEP